MQSGIEAEAGHIEEAGDIEEDIGDEADGATDGGTGVAGATCSDGPIDLIGGSIASMDVLTGRRVARPGPAGGGPAAPIGGGDLGDLARGSARPFPFETKSAGASGRFSLPTPDASRHRPG
jgi:hypothetical protein